MSESNQTLFGFPVVITDAVPKGELIVARLPTFAEVVMHGSYEAAVEALGSEYGIKARIVNLPIDNE
jgi:hypothetical protein